MDYICEISIQGWVGLFTWSGIHLRQPNVGVKPSTTHYHPTIISARNTILLLRFNLNKKRFLNFITCVTVPSWLSDVL
jgi:hypothetical protein